MTTIDYDYPRCTHNGFYAECVNDMRRENKLRGTREEKADALLFAGHLQYLQAIGETQALGIWNATLEDFAKCGSHVCLPDDPTQWLNAEELEMWHERSRLEVVRERIKPVLDNLPKRMTISCKVGGTRVLQLWELWEGTPVLVTAHRRDKVELADGTEVNDNRIKKDVRYRATFEEERLEDLASMCWCGMTRGLDIDRDGDNHLMKAFPLFEKNKIDEQLETEALNTASGVAVCYMLFMSREPEEVHVSRDPNWSPTPLPKKQRKQGKEPEREPQKIRIYVPKRKIISDPYAVLTENSSVGSKQMEHSREGHWRTYKDGRRIWIDTYTAGDPTLGTKLDTPRIVEIVPRRRS